MYFKPCPGEAHQPGNMADHCPVCIPLWAEIPMCDCGSPKPMSITPKWFVCKDCRKRERRPASRVWDESTLLE